MSFSPRFLDEIRSRLRLSEVIGRRVGVTRAGREFKACCPFHKEKSPSFTINDEKQFYHCFGCGAHGDVIGFVMQHDNLSFPDAVESLAAQAGLQVPAPDPVAVRRAEHARDLYKLMDITARWFEEQLEHPDNRAIAGYVHGRGLSEETRNAFRVGYAPADGRALRGRLLEAGYKDSDMIEAGVFKPSQKGGDPYLFFRERVIFPVSDRRGRVIAFGGRILPDSMRAPDRGDFKPPKYINSSDTPLFDKGRVLYAEAQARQAARTGGSVVVVEGYMDVLACHQAGVRGAVAPMGTALTENQIMSLWSMIAEGEGTPILCFDGDAAGRRAASNACGRILPLIQPGRSVRLAFLPDGEDPDSMIRGRGVSAFQGVLDAAISLFDFLWESHTVGRDFSTPESRAGLMKAFDEEVKAIADRAVQAEYSRLLKSRFYEKFSGGNRKGSAPGRQHADTGMNVKRPGAGQALMRSRIVLAALINHPSVYFRLEDDLAEMEMSDPNCRDLFDALARAVHSNPDIDSRALQAYLKDTGLEPKMLEILAPGVYIHAKFAKPDADPEDVWQKCRALIEEGHSRKMAGEIQQGWKDALKNSDSQEEERIMSMMMLKTAGENG